jgi:hypothetical protein
VREGRRERRVVARTMTAADRFNWSTYDTLLRLEFVSFAQRCLCELSPRAQFAMNWHIEIIAAKLMAVRAGKIRRLVINMPPRYLKPLLASVAFPAWCLGHEPAAQILCASYAQELADKLSRDCRRILASDWYRRIFPTRLSPERQAVPEFETTAQGCRLATSVGDVPTGRGADLIIIDDPLKAEEALSQTQRRAANEWFDHTLYSPFTIDVNLTDGKTHKISLYAQDFSHTGDIQNFTIKSANSGAILSSQDLSTFFNGVYQVWEISGHVTIVVRGATSPIPAITNGIFFDPPPPVTLSGHLTVPAGVGATPIGIHAPIDPNYSASQLSVRVAALPYGGRVTLSDGVTPVRIDETLTVGQLTSLKFVPSAGATTASTFAYTVTNPAARSTPESVLIAAEVVTAPPPPPTCSATGMESAPIVGNDSGRKISLLAPRSSIIPSDVAVLINDDDRKSIVAGQYFQLRHIIPDANMIHVSLPITPTEGANYAISSQEFSAIKAQVDAQLGTNIQAYVITWTQPYMVFGGREGAVGITSAFTYGYDRAAARSPHYFNSATYQPYTDFHIRPAMMLAGYTPQDIVSLIDRGALAQHILPTGDRYFIRTTDARRSDPRYADLRVMVGK